MLFLHQQSLSPPRLGGCQSKYMYTNAPGLEKLPKKMYVISYNPERREEAMQCTDNRLSCYVLKRFEVLLGGLR